MANHEAVQRVIGADFVGTLRVDATDAHDQVRVSLGLRGEVTAVAVLQLSAPVKSEGGLRETILEAANRAEAGRVMNELALSGAIDPEATDEGPTRLAPLPGPVAPALVVRTPAEQANHLARYVNNGGLEHIEAPGGRWTTSSNGYLSLAINRRGQIADVRVDQEWLYAVSLERLNKALKEAVES